MFILLVLFFLFLFLSVRHFTWRPKSWPEGALKPSLYQAHRGYWVGGARENTLAAFEAAKARGSTMIEFDVRLSLDQIPVAVHDASLERVNATSQMVSEMTAAELLEVAEAPSLDQVLSSKNIPSYLNIEIKSDKIWDGTLEKKVCEVIEKHKASERVLISSFNPLVLWRCKHYLPEVPRALLATQEDDPSNKIYLKKMWLAPYIGLHILHLDYRFITTKQIARYKSRQIPVAIWTLNDSNLARQFIEAGVVSIISDEIVE